MGFAQPPNPFFYRVQIVADRTALATSPLRPSSATAVMIQSLWTSSPRSSSFFIGCVCLFELFLQTGTLRNTRVPAVRAALLRPTGVAREKI